MSQTLVKQPSESRLYGINFSAQLASGETISSITSVAALPTGLTLSAQSISADAKSALVRIAGGTAAASHKVTAVVVTSAGNTLEGEGILLIKQL